jgi:hypothetical protein
MAQATDTRITPTVDYKAAALKAADDAAREPDRLKRRELEQQALRLWQAARRLRRGPGARSVRAADPVRAGARMEAAVVRRAAAGRRRLISRSFNQAAMQIWSKASAPIPPAHFAH